MSNPSLDAFHVSVWVSGVHSGYFSYCNENRSASPLSNFVQKNIPQRLQFADKFLEKYGAWAILIGRLTPFIPFDAVSYGAGLSKGINFRAFIVPTIIGVIPRAIFYCSLGVIIDDGLKSAFELTLFALAVIVGSLVMAYYLSLAKYKKMASLSKESHENRQKDGL